MGVGALLIFLGVALFSARVARPLAAAMSPVGTWAVVLLSVLFWPLFAAPLLAPSARGRRAPAAPHRGCLPQSAVPSNEPGSALGPLCDRAEERPGPDPPLAS